MNDLPIVYRERVRPEWVDRNGHFNAGFYMVAFDTAVGPWFRWCGVDRAADGERTHGTFTAESHTLYLRELEPDEAFLVTAQLLGFEGKKIHTFLRMHRADGEAVGELVATNEILSLFVDLDQRRAASLPAAVIERLEDVLRRHLAVGVSTLSGRGVGLSTPRPEVEGSS
ncbi:MAG: thioesterase family protein [Acidobacteriota bacterium]